MDTNIEYINYEKTLSNIISLEDGVYGKDGCISQKIQRTRIVA